MVEQAEIVSSLTPLNGIYFNIPNINDYAYKVVTLGKCLEYRIAHTQQLVSYVLYYDNSSEIFISMVWTHPEFQGKGHARRLLRQLIHVNNKNIRLEVHKDNPAVVLYRDLGFSFDERIGDMHKMSLINRIAIMQPYIFPYIGYFHLIHASNLFVFYDDVNYITSGWINRNRILLNQKDFLFTIPLSNSSQNKLINETVPAVNNSWRIKFNRTIYHAYKKAPYFFEVEPLIRDFFSETYENLADMAINSILKTCNYLNIPLNFTKSSICSPDTKGMGKADRLIEITRSQRYTSYVNSIGGINLYEKEYFRDRNIDIVFLESGHIEYRQYSSPFVPSLSIIDVLMFNDPIAVRDFLKSYTLI